MGGLGQSDQIRQALNYNLLKDQPELFARISGALNIREEQLSGPAAEPADDGTTPEETVLQEEENPITRFTVPYVVMMIFYVVILTSSSLLLNSINTEKKNRVIEILMTSVTPRGCWPAKSPPWGLSDYSRRSYGREQV